MQEPWWSGVSGRADPWRQLILNGPVTLDLSHRIRGNVHFMPMCAKCTHDESGSEPVDQKVAIERKLFGEASYMTMRWLAVSLNSHHPIIRMSRKLNVTQGFYSWAS
jgi:hypothetical protein